MNEKKLTDEIISEYYKTKFPMEDFMSFIGLSDFQNREFGFSVEDGRFIRNISFRNTKELREFLTNNSIRNAYVGAVYDKPPSKTNPIQKIMWKFREFIFDIDIDEYDLIRTCGCKGDTYCEDCWGLIQDASIFIDKTMKEDFGYKNIIWFFSGRRGVHGWVIDEDLKYFDQAQRVAILNYLTMIHDEKRSQNVEEIPRDAKTLSYRIYDTIAKSYLITTFPSFLKNPILQCEWCKSKHRAYDLFRNVNKEPKQKLSLNQIDSYVKENRIRCSFCNGELTNITKKELEEEFGLSEYMANKIIKDVKKSDDFDHNKFNIIIPNDTRTRRKLSQEIILRRYPRIDRKVTMDTRRVSRIPYSIHGKTGQIAIIIDDHRKFYPDDAPTVWDKLK